MPRRNNNAVQPRTRSRSATKQMAIRRTDGSAVLVTPITNVDDKGIVLVDMGGVVVSVQARSLISAPRTEAWTR